jgi:hypothetical protein
MLLFSSLPPYGSSVLAALFIADAPVDAADTLCA